MKRIIIHWTAGTYTPNNEELKHYHYLIGYMSANKSAYVKDGICKPEDNLNCYDGKYAAHTGGGNTGSIGIAICGNAGFKCASNQGKYPLQKVQFEKMYKTVAELCKKYAIVISKATVFTHYEFGKEHPETASKGKPDINFIPYEPNITPDAVGDFIRDKVMWYYERV